MQLLGVAAGAAIAAILVSGCPLPGGPSDAGTGTGDLLRHVVCMVVPNMVSSYF